MRSILLTLVMVVFAATSEAQPRIAVEKLEYNLGTVYAGQSLKSKFGIKNVGDKPLKILGIQPSCGCTAVQNPKSELAPGESDNVEIEFHSAGFRGDLVKYVTIVSNDSAMQNLSIRFKVLVKEELEPISQSAMVWFGSLNLGVEREQTYEMRNASGKTLRIKDVRASIPSLKASTDKKILKAGETIRVTIIAMPDRIGYVNEKVYVDTDSKNQPNVQISVTYIGTKGQP